VALIIGLILLVIATVFGLLGVRMVSNEERLANNAYDRQLAFQAAEAGLRRAEAAIEAVKPRPTAGCAVYSEGSESAMVCAAPVPAATPRWLDETFASWTPVAAGTSIVPDYFAEYLGDTYPCSLNPDCSSQPCNCLRYRVTARAGADGRAHAMVQSVYATDP
jgi:type IV pilus assembly protein PilX